MSRATTTTLATLALPGGTFTLRRASRDDARASGTALVQLTSDARRDDAHRFYERLGFTGSHVGFKLFL